MHFLNWRGCTDSEAIDHRKAARVRRDWPGWWSRCDHSAKYVSQLRTERSFSTVGGSAV